MDLPGGGLDPRWAQEYDDMTGVVMRLLASLAVGVSAAGAEASAQEAADRKWARAVRVANGVVRVDGRLDEPAWRDAPAVTDFTQKEPIEGAPATEPMEVRFVFDGAALYIGARMQSADPSRIQAPMGRRDNVDQAEYLQVSLDTYLDRRTAYTLGVTAAGVRFDHYHPSDNEDEPDSTFDPVWEAKTSVDEKGWTAEFWVPFSQLRFNPADALVWGLNIRRWTPTLNEEDYWVVVPRTEQGWASRFGELRGLDGVTPPRRFELLPYVAASSRLTGNRGGLNPFDNGYNGAGRVGADVKMSVGPNLTLDVTVNPDFGQVEADPAEVNLSVNETFFDERRPFFLEGSQLLAGASNNFFYSRRIGATPRGDADGDYVDYPAATTILGAAKLTGRLTSGTSLGLLGAVTGEESARTFNVGAVDLVRRRVAPRATYAVGRVQQEIGRQGSTVGMHVTALHRDTSEGDPLAQLLVRNAVSGAADAFVRLDDSAYEGRVVVGFSYVDGDPAAIERVQRTSVHYFQRPDRSGGPLLDVGRRSLAGMQLRSDFDRIAGRHWLWGVTVNADSPEFETNDVGRLTGAGEIDLRGRLTYRETQPGRVFRSYEFETEVERTTDWDRTLGATYSVASENNFTWSNFWETSIDAEVSTRGIDPRLTRGGPSMGAPRTWELEARFGNSGSSQTRWSGEVGYVGSENDDLIRGIGAGLSVRPAPSWQLSFDPSYVRERATRQFVARLDEGRPETFGSRYVFGVIDRSTLAMQVRFNYTFKPDLNLDFYAEPFAASGRYERFGELLAARSRDLRTYGEGATTITPQPDGSYLVTDGDASFALDSPDFNVRSFRSNLVLRWEFRPGSTLYGVWQQNREGQGLLSERAGLGSLFRSFSAEGDNILAIKASFWIAAR
jgi:hypothetical protein